MTEKNVFCVEALQAIGIELICLPSGVIVDATLQIHVHVCVWPVLLLRVSGRSRAALATTALSMLVLGIFRFGVSAHAFGTKGQVAGVD